jgi:hypothetical protein
LQIMADHPWFGVGWAMPDDLYQSYYMPPRLTEGALFTNSYAVLGAKLGLPALLCFWVYIWLSLTQKLSDKNVGAELEDTAWPKLTCRAGAVSLLFGFLFDGCLFKLPAAATFWILLELGAATYSRTNIPQLRNGE